MKLDLIIDLVVNVPTVTFALIVFMALWAALLVNHILKLGVYTTLMAVPVLVMAGLVANAAFIAHGIAVTPDKASNTAIAVSSGFTAVAVVTLMAFHIYAIANNR